LPQNADQSNDSALYIDDMVHPALRANFTSVNGFNVIEVNALFSASSPDFSGYWDDITFDLLPTPTLSVSNSGGNTVVSWAHSWILQSSPDLHAADFTDVLDGSGNFVTSPYTNTNTASQLFFRLRN